MSRSKMWGGRFGAGPKEIVQQFTESVRYDRRLAAYDVRGSLAHARMLRHIGVLEAEELREIERGLGEIALEIDAGTFPWSSVLEDVHMNIEARLTERIGEPGKKLHTARSRNDQVATDVRLYVRDATDETVELLRRLQSTIVDIAEREADTVMPGYTHLQPAQPVTFGHHLMAWFEMLQRDRERFLDARRRVDLCPLGAAALAGSSFPIDRHMTAAELGFDAPTRNSLDTVSDRDFLVEFNAHAALAMVHLSRIAEELVLWSSQAFGFVDLGDAFSTGSSIMPQKRNPDVAELVRGKASRVSGNLHALLMLMKGQPLAYNRDNQEDKEPIFDTVDTLAQCLAVLDAMLAEIRVRRERAREAAAEGYTTATDLADYLVRRGVPFRTAHEIVGSAVRAAIEEGVDLSELGLERLRSFSPFIDEDVFEVLTLDGSVAARDHLGGTAPARVRSAVAAARELLAEG